MADKNQVYKQYEIALADGFNAEAAKTVGYGDIQLRETLKELKLEEFKLRGRILALEQKIRDNWRKIEQLIGNDNDK